MDMVNHHPDPFSRRTRTRREGISYNGPTTILNSTRRPHQQRTQPKPRRRCSANQAANRWDEILADNPGDAEARRQCDAVHAEIVPERARRELSRSFDESVDFVRGRGGIRETEARVLRKLHWYRNELY